MPQCSAIKRDGERCEKRHGDSYEACSNHRAKPAPRELTPCIVCDTLTSRHDGRCYRQQCGGAASQKRALAAKNRAKSVSLAKARAEAPRLAAEERVARADAEASYHAETRARLSPEKAIAADLGGVGRAALREEYLAAIQRLDKTAFTPQDDDDSDEGEEDDTIPVQETTVGKFTKEAEKLSSDAGIAAQSLVRAINQPAIEIWMPMPLRVLYETIGEGNLDDFHELAGRLIDLADSPDVFLRDDPSELLGVMVDLVADLEREGEAHTAGAPRAARLAAILDKAHGEAFTRSAEAKDPPQWAIDAMATDKAQTRAAKEMPAATAMSKHLPRFYGMTTAQKVKAYEAEAFQAARNVRLG